MIFNENTIDAYSTSMAFIKKDTIINSVQNYYTFSSNRIESPNYDLLAKYIFSLITNSNMRQKRNFNFPYLAELYINEFFSENDTVYITNAENYFLLNLIDSNASISEMAQNLQYSSSFSEYAMYNGKEDYYGIYLHDIEIEGEDTIKQDEAEIESIKKKYENFPAKLMTNGETISITFNSGSNQNLKLNKSIFALLNK